MTLLALLLVLAAIAVAGGMVWLRHGVLRDRHRRVAAVIVPRPLVPRPLPGPLAALAVLSAEALPPGCVALRLRQEGMLRLTETGRWLPFHAVQTVSLTKPAFAWVARARLHPRLPVPVIEVIDTFDGREALLEARLMGVLRMARAEGAGLAVAEAQRYIAELPWAPGALAGNGHLDFRVRGPCIEVAAPAGRNIARAELLLDEEGRIVAAGAAARARGGGAAVEHLPWGGAFEDWDDSFGPPMPRRAEVWWDLPGGRFTYFRARITGLEALDAGGRVLPRQAAPSQPPRAGAPFHAAD